jgi:hypothetical protein
VAGLHGWMAQVEEQRADVEHSIQNSDKERNDSCHLPV